jgi:outer membrane protein assembly factor BamB
MWPAIFLELAFEMRSEYRAEWTEMRRIAFAIFACVAIAFGAAAALARGEISYTMPEVRETVPPSDSVVHTALWSHPVSDASDVLAIGPNVVTFAASDLMCGFNGATGAQLWCDGKGSHPAYAAGVVAYTAADGSVHGVDADTGALLWKHSGAVRQYITANYAASTGDDFLLSSRQQPVDTGKMTYGQLVDATYVSYAEITPSGHVLWSGEGDNYGDLPNPDIFRPYAFQINTGPGATIMSSLQVLNLGPDGGVGAAIHNTGDVLHFNSPNVTLAGGWRAQEVEDFFLTFDIETADVRDGTVVAMYHYEPDYDANLADYNRGLFPGGLRSGDVRADSEFVYGAVSSKLYRYRLAVAAGQSPLLVASDSLFLGGPYRGALYVSRSDGVWALRVDSTRIRARLVAPSASPVSGLSITGRTAYIAFADGEVRGVNVDDGRTVLDAWPGKEARVGVSTDRTFVVCRSDTGWEVVAYDRPDRP